MMMSQLRRLVGVGVVCLLPVSVCAQAATVAVFAAAAGDPNTATPVATAVVYAAPTCNQAVFTESPPITNPFEGYYTDPTNATRDCQLSVTPQMTALPFSTSYKAAVKVGAGLYGPFSTSFAVAPQALPPPSLPTNYIVNVVLASAPNPLTALPVANGTITIPYSAGICNQPPFPAPPPAVETASARFSWNDPVNAGRLCVSPQAAFLAALAPAGSATVAGYVFRLTAMNATDSVLSTTVSNGFSILAPVPTVTGIAPVSGAVGLAVTITGTNFTGATAVRFNGTTATFTVTNATTITTSVPAGATTGPVTVVTPGGTATSATFTVTVPLAAPSGLQVRP